MNEVWTLIYKRNLQIQLRIVGNLRMSTEFPKLPNVEFTGPVDDLTAEYAAASVALVPLRAGSGLKIKLVEALAHGVPVVSTSVGAAGVEAAPPSVVQIRNDPMDFARAIQCVVTAPNWAALSEEAAEFAPAPLFQVSS